jgi:hypothetical protein
LGSGGEFGGKEERRREERERKREADKRRGARAVDEGEEGLEVDELRRPGQPCHSELR